MKKYILPSFIAIASVMLICLCVFRRGKAKTKLEIEE